jgi:hypothetical protein
MVLWEELCSLLSIYLIFQVILVIVGKKIFPGHKWGPKSSMNLLFLGVFCTTLLAQMRIDVKIEFWIKDVLLS